MKLPAVLRALKGNNLQRWSDPRPSRLAIESVSCAVIFYIVAVHRELPEPVDLEIEPCHSPQLEPNAGGGHRQCVWTRSRY
jgi:hypothetical protein